MPAYVTPDGNDYLVYTLDESGSPWANTGAAGALDVTPRAAGPVAAAGIFNNGVSLPGAYNTQEFLTTGDTAAGENGLALTVSCWVYLDNYQSGQYGVFVEKEYALQGSTWVNPAVLLGYANNNQGLIRFGITIAGTFYGYNANFSTSVNVALNGWHHLALTWDGHTLCAYLDGLQIEARVPVGGSNAIDFGAHGPWTFGGDDSDSATINGAVDDVRVANVARSFGYLAVMGYVDFPAEVEGGSFIDVFPPDVPGTVDIVPGVSAAASVGGTVNFPTNYRKFNHGLDTP
jgi:hypothetical protein